MAATSGIMLPVGLRHVQVFALDSNGRPAASSTSAYEGVQITGSKAFDANFPDPRQIDHSGDDYLLGRDILPPLTGGTITLSAAKSNFTVHALLTGTNVTTIGESKEIGHLTSKQGFESQVGLMFWQQAIDSSGTSVEGLRRWRVIMLPKAYAIPKPQGMGENTVDVTYNVTPQIVTQRLWGVTLATGTEGYANAQAFEYMCEYKPKVVSWKSASGTPTKMLFPTDAQAVSTAKIHLVTVNGVTDATATKAVDGVTPTTIAANDIITCFYEYA